MDSILLLIPLVVMAAPILIVLMVLRYQHRQTQERYSTLLQLAEKGVELPAQLLIEPQTYSERRRALVLISTGIGIMLTLLALPGQFEDGHSIHELWGLGLLPLMTGVGYLASWWLNRRGDVRG